MATEFPELQDILRYFTSRSPEGAAKLLGAALTPEEIDRFEARYQFRLPHVLRAFYLMHNGLGDDIRRGSPHHVIVPMQSLGEVAGAFRNTLLNHRQEVEEERQLTKKELHLVEPEVPEALYPIGMDSSGDVYYLDLSRRTKQGMPVFLLHHDAAFETDAVAESIEEFVLDFLERRLGVPEGKERPRLPRYGKVGKTTEGETPAALVRAALPTHLRTTPMPETAAAPAELRILSEHGSSNWRHSSAPEGGGGGIRDVLFTASGFLVSLGQDALIHVWDPASGRVVRTLEVPGTEPDQILLSPDETTLAVLWREEYDSEAVDVTVLNFADGAEVCHFQADGFRSGEFAASGARFVVLTEGNILTFDSRTGKRLQSVSLKREPSQHLAVSSDGERLATDMDGQFPVVLRDGSGRKQKTLEGGEGEIRHLCFCGQGDRFLAIAADGLLVVDLDTLEAWSHPLPVSDYRVCRSGRDRLVLTEFLYRKYDRIGFVVGIMDLPSGAVRSSHKFDYVWGQVNACLSADGERIALVYEQDLRVDLRSLSDWKRLNPQEATFIDAVLEGVTATHCVWICRDTVRVTDLAGRSVSTRTLSGDDPTLFQAAASADGTLAAVSDSDCRVHLLTLPDLEPVTVFKTGRHAKALAFSPVDRRLLVGCDDGTLLLLGEGATKPTKLPKWLSAYTGQVAWSADGSLALAADGVKVVLFDVAHRKLTTDRLSQGEYTWAVDFSPDGSRLLVAGRDVSLRVLDLEGQELLRVPDLDVGRAYFTGDGRILVIQLDGSIVILDEASGRRVSEHNLHDTHDCFVSVVPARDRRSWFLKSSRGRFLTCQI